MVTKTKSNKTHKQSRNTFQTIPHWDDPEIGYKALLRCIKSYVSQKRDEFKRLEPIITDEEFIWDTFYNMCRRNGYPQYNKEKNRGNFYSFVKTCCARNQADWARKRNTRYLQLAELQGVDRSKLNKNELPEFKPMLSLDKMVEGSDDQSIYEKIGGNSLDVYTEEMALEEISRNISEDKISDRFKISWKEFAELLMKGWSVVDISKSLEVHPTTTRKYYAMLKDQMLHDDNIHEILELSGMVTE